MIKLIYLAEQIIVPEYIRLYFVKRNENLYLSSCNIIYESEKLLYSYDLTNGEMKKLDDGLTLEKVKNNSIQINGISNKDIALEFVNQACDCEIIADLKFYLGKKEFWYYFSKYIEDDGLNNYGFNKDYSMFWTDYPLKRAKEFCDNNGIEYEKT